MCGVDAVGGEAVCEGVAEVAGMQDEDVVAGFGEVGRDEVPAYGAAAGDDERLGGGGGGLEEFAEEREGFAEGGDERGADVGLAEGSS